MIEPRPAFSIRLRPTYGRPPDGLARRRICDACHRSLQLEKRLQTCNLFLLEATVTRQERRGRRTSSPIKLGALILRCMGPQGGEVLRVIDESGLTFAQMKVLVELQTTRGGATPSRRWPSTSASPPPPPAARRMAWSEEARHPGRGPGRSPGQAAGADRQGRRLADRIISARLASLEEFTGSLEADQRRKLESALDALMERQEVAEIYAQLREEGEPMTRYRHLVTDDNRKWWTLGAMCFALFMVMLDNTVVNVALPSIQREIHAQLSASSGSSTATP